MRFRTLLAGVLCLVASAAFGQGTQFPAGTIWGNDTAAQRPGKTSTVTAILDRAFGSTRGAILERGASGWALFNPSGTARVPYLSGGGGADPLYGAYTLPASVTSGGLACFTSTSAQGSSVLLTANALVLGGGAGVCPSPMGSLGATTTVLHGNAGGAPTFGAVVSADLTITATNCTNQFVTAISTGGVGTCTTDTLASAQHANQGTTTTVLHGNAAGNPSFGPVSLTADITGTLGFGNGGTADTGTASATYTITATCSGGGSLTSAGLANSRFKQLFGKFYFVRVEAILTTIGTCVGPIDYSLPAAVVSATLQGDQVIMGREMVNNGKSMQGRMLDAGTSVRAAYYDNSTALANGDKHILEGIIEVK